MLSYLIGVWKTDGKSWWKNFTALLAEICQPGPAETTLDEEDSRECKEGRSQDRAREREREMRFGYKPHSRAQFPSQALVCVSGDYWTHRLHKDSGMRFSLFLGLSLEICRRQAVLPAWQPCLLKGHEVWVKLNDTLYVLLAENTLPIEMASNRLSFLSRSLISLSRGLWFGCLEWHLFSPKEILSCVSVWGSDWESTRPWSATHVIRDPSW